VIESGPVELREKLSGQKTKPEARIHHRGATEPDRPRVGRITGSPPYSRLGWVCLGRGV